MNGFLKYVSEFRDQSAAQALAAEIARQVPNEPIRIMEVCGGHTVSIFKFGLRSLLPTSIKLMSGPGCPVCVTDNRFIDHAIELSKNTGMIIATFGDMIRVPGSRSSLLRRKEEGADVRICYSTLDAIELAKTNPSKQIVFLGIGFETTAPTVAAAIKHARDERLPNFSVLTALKTMPRALEALVTNGETRIDALICPGHVTAITGLSIYEFLARDHGIPCVVSGFEPLDLLHSVLMIVRQLRDKTRLVENQYSRTVSPTGNQLALNLISEVFEPIDSNWRGLGVIPGSGLRVADGFSEFDASKRFPIELQAVHENRACICGEIMRGVKIPTDCKLFGKACTPEEPVGSCMVSEEGSCATYFKFARPQT